ncbi:MAG: hypothetical protein ACOCQR_03235 [bacterium]
MEDQDKDIDQGHRKSIINIACQWWLEHLQKEYQKEKIENFKNLFCKVSEVFIKGYVNCLSLNSRFGNESNMFFVVCVNCGIPITAFLNGIEMYICEDFIEITIYQKKESKSKKKKYKKKIIYATEDYLERKIEELEKTIAIKKRKLNLMKKNLSKTKKGEFIYNNKK